jgi:hypothetical protein
MLEALPLLIAQVILREHKAGEIPKEDLRRWIEPKKAIANVPRWPLPRFSVPFTVRLLGGYSLLILTR